MAKRYTLATLLGLSATDDKEKQLEKTLEKTQGTMFAMMLSGIKRSKENNENEKLENQKKVLIEDTEKFNNGRKDEITYQITEEQRKILLEKINNK